MDSVSVGLAGRNCSVHKVIVSFVLAVVWVCDVLRCLAALVRSFAVSRLLLVYAWRNQAVLSNTHITHVLRYRRMNADEVRTEVEDDGNNAYIRVWFAKYNTVHTRCNLLDVLIFTLTLEERQ